MAAPTPTVTQTIGFRRKNKVFNISQQHDNTYSHAKRKINVHHRAMHIFQI